MQEREKTSSFMLELRNRTEDHVRIYYRETQDEEIRGLLPSSARSLEDALTMYRQSLQPNAKSVGKTVYFNGEYVGDIWCYGLGEEEPDAMLSYCIFRKELWGKGIATQAVSLFLKFVQKQYAVKTVGAFTYCDNIASQKVLTANGFQMMETFTEDGRQSVYYEIAL